MILKLVVPKADSAFEGGTLTKWYFEEGDSVPFGAPVCDVSIDEFLALQRTKRASLLGSTSKRKQRKVKDGVYRREGRGSVTIRLICAESGMTLRRREVEEGDRVRIGSCVALLGSVDADIPATLPDVEARISTDFPSAEELDPFD